MWCTSVQLSNDAVSLTTALHYLYIRSNSLCPAFCLIRCLLARVFFCDLLFLCLHIIPNKLIYSFRLSAVISCLWHDLLGLDKQRPQLLCSNANIFSWQVSCFIWFVVLLILLFHCIHAIDYWLWFIITAI